MLRENLPFDALFLYLFQGDQEQAEISSYSMWPLPSATGRKGQDHEISQDREQEPTDLYIPGIGRKKRDTGVGRERYHGGVYPCAPQDG